MDTRDTAFLHWSPSPDVLWTEHGGMTTIVSFGTGKYTTLDEIAGRIWQQLCVGDSVNEIGSGLAQIYHAETAAVARDVSELVGKLRERKLIRPRTGSPRRASAAVKAMPSEVRSNPPSVIFCIIVLALSHVGLYAFGIRRLMRKLPRYNASSEAPSRAKEWLRKLERNIHIASSIYPLRAACLEESFGFLWLSRRVGLATQLRIGLQPSPFTAHAWVQFAGEAFLDNDEYLAKYCGLPPVDDSMFDNV